MKSIKINSFINICEIQPEGRDATVYNHRISLAREPAQSLNSVHQSCAPIQQFLILSAKNHLTNVFKILTLGLHPVL